MQKANTKMCTTQEAEIIAQSHSSTRRARVSKIVIRHGDSLPAVGSTLVNHTTMASQSLVSRKATYVDIEQLS